MSVAGRGSDLGSNVNVVTLFVANALARAHSAGFYRSQHSLDIREVVRRLFFPRKSRLNYYIRFQQVVANILTKSLQPFEKQ